MQKFHWVFIIIIVLISGCNREPASVPPTAVPTSPAAPSNTPAPAEPTAAASPSATPPAADSGSAADSAVDTAPPPPLMLAWQVKAGGAINQSPLVVEDIVIVIAHNENVIRALSLTTGEALWQVDSPERVWDRAFASNGRVLFVGVDGGKLLALNIANGALAWQAELGINIQIPPLVVDDSLFIATTFVGPGLEATPQGKAAVFSLNPNDGHVLWEFESENYILQTPTYYDGTLYVAGSYRSEEDVEEGGPMRIYALDASSGDLQWAYESFDGFPKQLYATDTAVAYIAYQDFVSGVDAKTGQPLWRRDTGNWVPTLFGHDEIIYFGSANTMVHALNTNDGKTVWQFNIPEGTFNYVIGAPRQVNQTLYFLTQQGDIFALDALNGRFNWEYSTNIEARTGLTATDNWLIIGDAEGIVYGYQISG
ncbi:MAG: PQQ-binding-like beta-propeller repeat protein [Anaerolineae bacterium]